MRKATKNAVILFQHECNYIICTIGKTKQIIVIKYVRFQSLQMY